MSKEPCSFFDHKWERKMVEATTFSSYMPEYLLAGYFCVKCGVNRDFMSEGEKLQMIVYEGVVFRVFKELGVLP